MRIIDKGKGTPVVLVPGLQGRWEYLQSTVDALSRSQRVVTFSLCDEPSWGESTWGDINLDRLVKQIDDVLDSRGLEGAVICGVSFGGLVALRFAATRPQRTTALVLASAPGPGWHLKRTHRRYVRFPWVSAPLFLAGMPRRLRKEIATAIPNGLERLTFIGGLLSLLVRAPLSPARMAARARLIDGVDNVGECAHIASPTLLITGEPELDHVVPADGTIQYARLIPGSVAVTLRRTGHLGCLTRPTAFADAIGDFLRRAGVTSRSGEHAA